MPSRSDTSATTIGLVVRLSNPAERIEAGRALAARLGVEEFLFLVRDPELDILIPAPGFPQTLRGGPLWRAFLAQCRVAGRHRGFVDFPVHANRPALAFATEGNVAILLGGSADVDEAEMVEPLMPLLGFALRAEQQVFIAHAEATEARGAASRALSLSTALEASRAEGARLNEQLREEDSRKDIFLAMLGHELRNPLAPLVTSIYLLKMGALDAAGTVDQLDVMARQVHQLSRIVEDLLDVSRVSRGRIALRKKPTDLGVLLLLVVETCRPLFAARRHALTLDISKVSLIVNGDDVRLTQIFTNLIQNAIKYTDPGGRIDIGLWRENDDAVVAVQDNGVGIAHEMISHVFDLFAQAPVSIDRAQGGMGIGLTLVQALVRLHGGRVSVESAGIGCGSRFLVRLPIYDLSGEQGTAQS